MSVLNLPNKVVRRFDFLFWSVKFSFRSSKNLWGRFGGGWNWKVGIQAGGTTIVFSLLICEVVINKRQRGLKQQ